MKLESSTMDAGPRRRWLPPASDPGREGDGTAEPSPCLPLSRLQPQSLPQSLPLPQSMIGERTSHIDGSHEIPGNQERLPVSGMTLLYCPHCGKPAAPVPDGLAPALWAAIQIQVARLGTSLECQHCLRRSLIRQSPVPDQQPNEDGEAEIEEEP